MSVVLIEWLISFQKGIFLNHQVLISKERKLT